MILGKMQISGERTPIIVAVEYTNATSTIARISHNLGVSHSATTISGKIASNLALAVAIGHDIRNIAISVNGTSSDGTFVSKNEGVSFSEIATNYSYQLGIDISSDGNYIYHCSSTNNIIKRSANGGTSFASNISTLTPFGVACSSNGQIVVYSSPTLSQYVRYSSNALGTINSTYWQASTTHNIYGIDITDDGSNIFTGTHADTAAVVNSYLGSQVTLATGLTSGSTMVFCSGSGQYVLAYHSGAGRAWVSNNYGSTWTEVLSGTSTKYIVFGTAVSNSGKYMVMGETTTNGRYYLSQDFGVNWSTINVSGSSQIIRAVAIQD